MMLNDDDLFLVGCVKLSAIKNFMRETAGNDEIARAFQCTPPTGMFQRPVHQLASVFVKEKESGPSI